MIRIYRLMPSIQKEMMRGVRATQIHCFSCLILWFPLMKVPNFQISQLQQTNLFWLRRKIRGISLSRKNFKRILVHLKAYWEKDISLNLRSILFNKFRWELARLIFYHKAPSLTCKIFQMHFWLWRTAMGVILSCYPYF